LSNNSFESIVSLLTLYTVLLQYSMSFEAQPNVAVVEKEYDNHSQIMPLQQD
jgi:hypothetical protein